MFSSEALRGLAVCSSNKAKACGAHNVLRRLAERTMRAVVSQRSTVLPTSNWPAAHGREQDAADPSSFHRACPRQASPLAIAETRMLRAAAPQVYTTPQGSPAVHRLAETARVTLSLLRWRRQSTSLPESFPSTPARSGLRATKSAVPLSLFPPKLPRRRQRGVPSCHRCASTRFKYLSAPVHWPQRAREHGAGPSTKCRLAPLRPPGQAALPAAPAQ